MAYTKIGWKNNVTPLNEQNLDKMDQGILEAHQALDDLGTIASQFQTIKNDVNELKASAGFKFEFDSTTGSLKIGK